MVDHDLVADLDVGDVLAGGVDDAGEVAPADVEVVGLTGLLMGGDLVHGVAPGRPDVVVVDARRHDGDEDFVGADGGHVDHLGGEGGLGRAVAALADDLGVHLPGYPADGRHRPDGDGLRCRVDR